MSIVHVRLQVRQDHKMTRAIAGLRRERSSLRTAEPNWANRSFALTAVVLIVANRSEPEDLASLP